MTNNLYVAIICGSRSIPNTVQNVDKITKVVENNKYDIIEIVSGGANGGDKVGERWAKEYDKDLTIMPANWGYYGKSAGMKRNLRMINYILDHPSEEEPLPLVIALYDGESKGTKHMILKSRVARIKTEVIDCAI